MSRPDAPPPVGMRSRMFWKVAPPAIRGVGRAFFSLRVERESDLPDPPFVVAANHYSHFDSPAIAAAIDMRIRFLALEELFTENAVVAWLVTGFEAIPTPRDRTPVGAVRGALHALEEGEVVGVFPESTRVSHWGTLSPKRGAAWLAVRTGVPLVPVAVLGTGQALGLENRLRRAPIRVVVGRPLESRDADADELTERWSAWMTSHVTRHPHMEVEGPPRTSLRP